MSINALTAQPISAVRLRAWLRVLKAAIGVMDVGRMRTFSFIYNLLAILLDEAAGLRYERTLVFFALMGWMHW